MDNGRCRPEVKCDEGEFFNGRKCQECSDNCNECQNAEECLKCRKGFELETIKTKKDKEIVVCDEVCGDGWIFEDQCDDGNNKNGDGCSSECKIEKGWTCKKTGTEGPSVCREKGHSGGYGYGFIRPKISVALFGRVIHGCAIENIPSFLLQNDCEWCDDILDINVLPGYRGGKTPRIRTNYLRSRKNLFLIEFKFEATFVLPVFDFEIGIKPKYHKYFNADNAEEKQKVRADPSTLAQFDEHTALSFDALTDPNAIDIPPAAEEAIFGGDFDFDF